MYIAEQVVPAHDKCMDSKPGTYVLILQCSINTLLPFGRWGHIETRPGFYIYVGSAFGPGGLSARVSRHCQQRKAKFWHVDYLREVTDPVSVWFSYAAERLEHFWAGAMAKMKHAVPVKRFGCSDCKCETHLFYMAKEPELATFLALVDGSIEIWTLSKEGNESGGCCARK